jgi:hypothetical protein
MNADLLNIRAKAKKINQFINSFLLRISEYLPKNGDLMKLLTDNLHKISFFGKSFTNILVQGIP